MGALGNPPVNGIKYFATADLLEQIKDSHWLARMSAAIYQHWQKKNSFRKSCITERLASENPVSASGL